MNLGIGLLLCRLQQLGGTLIMPPQIAKASIFPSTRTASMNGSAVNMDSPTGAGLAVLVVGTVAAGTLLIGSVEQSDDGVSGWDSVGGLDGAEFAPDIATSNRVATCRYERTKPYLRCVIQLSGGGPSVVVAALLVE